MSEAFWRTAWERMELASRMMGASSLASSDQFLNTVDVPGDPGAPE